MRVCLDVQSALGHRTGVGRYTHALAAHLASAAQPGEKIEGFYFDFRGRGAGEGAPPLPARRIRWIPGRIAQQSWKRLRFPPFNWMAGKYDLYHFPNFIRPPLTRGKSVVTIHDVSFLRMPETTERKNLRYLTDHIRETVERSDRIITDSRAMADDIHDLLGAPRDRLRPIYPGLERSFAPPRPDWAAAARARLGLSRPYLLFVGTLEPRKNIPLLVDIFERLADEDWDLVLVGMRGWRCEPILRRIEDSPRHAHIRWLEYAAEEDLPSIYAGAECLVFPSRYEGFGFPPLEAMACGAPVISSTGGSLREVLEGGALLMESFDADLWAESIRRLCHNSAERSKLRAQGFAHAARYAWDQTARETWTVYRELA
ncbi:MAG: glycosyltransferase family 4 protein [Kiritimatiellae bacterium]|nr:glycosyltransferase family 4 protein [Kiritimatiellia bacterium]